jgi:hypothetical protein
MTILQDALLENLVVFLSLQPGSYTVFNIITVEKVAIRECFGSTREFVWFQHCATCKECLELNSQ